MYNKYPLGVIPSPQDDRDYKVSMFYEAPPKYPDSYQIAYTPGVYDQGQVGQCVAFALAGKKESQEWKERGQKVRYAPSFIYGNRTDMQYQGEGMIPREALSMLMISGVPEWDVMPWIKEYPECREYVRQNRAALHEVARPQRLDKYFRINSHEEEMTALLNTNNPVMFCIAVYPSFYEVDKTTGIVPDVKPFESILGYHAMLSIGWTTIEGRKYRIVLNSWGKEWGKNGLCLIPVDYKGNDETWGTTDHDPKTPPKKRIVLTLDSKELWNNGNTKTMDVAPFIKDGRTFVPVRFVAEELGFIVGWDGLEKKIYITEV